VKLTEFLNEVINADWQEASRIWDGAANLAHITGGRGPSDWIEVDPALSELKMMIEAGIFEDVKKEI